MCDALAQSIEDRTPRNSLPLESLLSSGKKHFNSLEHPLDVQCGHQRRLLVAPGGDPYDVGVIYRQDPCLVSCLMESWVETAERNV